MRITSVEIGDPLGCLATWSDSSRLTRSGVTNVLFRVRTSQHRRWRDRMRVWLVPMQRRRTAELLLLVPAMRGVRRSDGNAFEFWIEGVQREALATASRC